MNPRSGLSLCIPSGLQTRILVQKTLHTAAWKCKQKKMEKKFSLQGEMNYLV